MLFSICRILRNVQLSGDSNEIRLWRSLCQIKLWSGFQTFKKLKNPSLTTIKIQNLFYFWSRMLEQSVFKKWLKVFYSSCQNPNIAYIEKDSPWNCSVNLIKVCWLKGKSGKHYVEISWDLLLLPYFLTNGICNC